jgi:hypothetical protein
MAELLYSQPFTLTQGGADTSGEVTMQTGLLPGIDLAAWELVGLEYHLSSVLVKTWAAADANLIVQLTKRSLAAGYSTLTYADNDLVTQHQWAAMLTGAGTSMQVFPTTYFIELPPGALIYAPAIYLQLMSVGTGAANSIHGRVLYTPRKLTTNEAFAIVASRP